MGCAFSLDEDRNTGRKSDKQRLTSDKRRTGNFSRPHGLGGGKLPSMPEDMQATRNRATSDDFFTPGGALSSDGPRLHKSKLSLIRRGSAELSTQERYTPLLECSDELLLKEIMRRKINIKDKVSEELINSKYKFGKLLGQGSSASVYEAEHRRTGNKVAIKVIKRDGDMNDDESMATELDILRTVRHRYVLNCIEIFEAEHCIWVVMELIRGGELLEVIIEQGTYSEVDASRAMKQVLMSVRYLHSQGIVHRDLKLQNLLLTEKDAKKADLKVADFGLSAVLTGQYSPSEADAMKAFNKLRDRWGTPHYFAPEMVQKAYGPQVDIWALGVVLFQLLVGRLPFNGSSNTKLFEQIMNTPAHLDRLMAMSEWNGISQTAKDLVRQLLIMDPIKRPSADEALQHPWIALKGSASTGNLSEAYKELKGQLAKRKITDMVHVLDIMNALEMKGGPGSEKSTAKAKRNSLPPQLTSQVSKVDAIDEVLSPGKAKRKKHWELGGNDMTDTIDELQSVFKLFDRDNNGNVDVDEINVFMKKLGFHPDEAKVREVVNKVDKNRNGKLEFDEFCEFLKIAKTSLGVEQQVAHQLQQVAGSDGYLQAEDISDILTTLGEHTGQAIDDSEIADVVALSLITSGDRAVATPEAIAHSLMMNANQRNKARQPSQPPARATSHPVMRGSSHGVMGGGQMGSPQELNVVL